MRTVGRLVLTGDDARALAETLYRPSKAYIAERKKAVKQLEEGITLTEDGTIVQDLNLPFLSNASIHRKENDT